MIPQTFLSAGISTRDIVAKNLIYIILALVLCTMIQPFLLEINVKSIISTRSMSLSFMMISLRHKHMAELAGVSVKCIISLLHHAKFSNTKFKSNVPLHGATFKLIVTSDAVGYTRVRALII